MLAITQIETRPEWTAPADRGFIEHDPNWQRLDHVAQSVIDGLDQRRPARPSEGSGRACAMVLA